MKPLSPRHCLFWQLESGESGMFQRAFLSTVTTRLQASDKETTNLSACRASIVLISLILGRPQPFLSGNARVIVSRQGLAALSNGPPHYLSACHPAPTGRFGNPPSQNPAIQIPSREKCKSCRTPSRVSPAGKTVDETFLLLPHGFRLTPISIHPMKTVITRLGPSQPEFATAHRDFGFQAARSRGT